MALLTTVNSIAVQPATFKHVRSIEPRIRQAIADGYARSPTFRELVDTVEGLSCVVYIGSIVKLSEGMRGALLHRPAGNPEMPVIRVLLKASLSHDEAIAVIGHELQHVIEVVKGAPAAERLDWATTLDQPEQPGQATPTRKHETDLAIAVTAKVTDELKKCRRAQAPSPRSELNRLSRCVGPQASIGTPVWPNFAPGASAGQAGKSPAAA